jgi:hypothetical protein
VKILSVFGSVLGTALNLYLIYKLGYWFVWSGGLLAGIMLGMTAGVSLMKQVKS